MKELKIIRELFHAQFLHVRNLNNLVHSDNFEVAFSLANDIEREKVCRAIIDMDKERIKIFIEEKLNGGTPFDQLSIRKLREIGKFMRISNYNILNKLTLIEEIRNVAKRLKEDSQRKYFQSKQTECYRKNIN